MMSCLTMVSEAINTSVIITPYNVSPTSRHFHFWNTINCSQFKCRHRYNPEHIFKILPNEFGEAIEWTGLCRFFDVLLYPLANNDGGLTYISWRLAYPQRNILTLILRYIILVKFDDKLSIGL